MASASKAWDQMNDSERFARNLEDARRAMHAAWKARNDNNHNIAELTKKLEEAKGRIEHHDKNVAHREGEFDRFMTQYRMTPWLYIQGVPDEPKETV